MKKNCINCTKIFEARDFDHKRGYGKFCNKICRKEYVSPKNNFFRKIKIKDSNNCWEWMGYIGKRGYGSVCDGNKTKLAHRFSWELHNGVIPIDLFVLHKCDNRACVNPSHLFLGSQKENMEDMVKKGRCIRASAENCGRSKLSRPDVLKIKILINMNQSLSQIARDFNVSVANIWNIKHKQTWKEV